MPRWRGRGRGLSDRLSPVALPKCTQQVASLPTRLLLNAPRAGALRINLLGGLDLPWEQLGGVGVVSCSGRPRIEPELLKIPLTTPGPTVCSYTLGEYAANRLVPQLLPCNPPTTINISQENNVPSRWADLCRCSPPTAPRLKLDQAGGTEINRAPLDAQQGSDHH